MRPVERQAVLDQPLCEIDAGDSADRDSALVPVAVNLDATDGAAGNEGIKIVRSLLPAAIVFAAMVPAELIGLGRIDAPLGRMSVP